MDGNKKVNVEVTINPDKEFVAEVRKNLAKNNHYCPCAIVKTPDTKCMCKNFRDMFGKEDGWCECGLYHVTNKTK